MTSVAQWRTAAGLERLDCEVLLAKALDCNRAQILAHPERRLDDGALQRLDVWRERRMAGEPIAYILETKEFWGLDLTVTPDVLIPRPETELLVERTLAIARGGEQCLELGTGSGAVAIALARDARSNGRPIHVTATDISPAALHVARHNGRRHNAAVTWLQSDWFCRVDDTFDLIVSNPPYVADGDPHLQNLAMEPRLALVAGPEGLDAIRQIVAGATAHLRPGGHLLLEHGFAQGHAVRELMAQAGLCAVRSYDDLAGHARVTRGQSAP